MSNLAILFVVLSVVIYANGNTCSHSTSHIHHHSNMEVVTFWGLENIGGPYGLQCHGLREVPIQLGAEFPKEQVLQARFLPLCHTDVILKFWCFHAHQLNTLGKPLQGCMTLESFSQSHATSTWFSLLLRITSSLCNIASVSFVNKDRDDVDATSIH